MKLKTSLIDQETKDILDEFVSHLLERNPKRHLRTIGDPNDVKMVKKSELLAGKSPEDINRS